VRGLTGEPLLVAEAIRVGRVLEYQASGVEHARLLHDIAVSHVQDALVAGPVEVAEEDVHHDGLGVRVVELEARAPAGQVLGGVARVAGDHRSADVGQAQLGGQPPRVVGLHALQ